MNTKLWIHVRLRQEPFISIANGLQPSTNNSQGSGCLRSPPVSHWWEIPACIRADVNLFQILGLDTPSEPKKCPKPHWQCFRKSGPKNWMETPSPLLHVVDPEKEKQLAALHRGGLTSWWFSLPWVNITWTALPCDWALASGCLLSPSVTSGRHWCLAMWKKMCLQYNFDYCWL